MLTRAKPRRASIGPSVQMLARMVRTMSYRAWLWLSSWLWMSIIPPAASGEPALVRSTLHPSSLSSRTMFSMSASSATSRSITGRSVSSAAAISGSAAFLEPFTVSLPHNRRPPLMTN